MDKRTAILAGSAVATVAVIAAYLLSGKGSLEIASERIPIDKLDVEVLSSEILTSDSLTSDSLSLGAVPDFGLRASRRAETRAIVASAHEAVAAHGFYVAVGQFDATASWAELEAYWPNPQSGKALLVFRYLTDDWREVYAGVLSKIPEAVCAIDCRPGEFEAATVEEFVRETGAKEVVLSWSMANQIDQGAELAGIAQDVAGTAEAVKRGNPKCFVWLTVCYGVGNANNWVALTQGLPFDGVALWNIHSLPAGWQRAGFLARPLKWAQERFGGKPVALAGLFGAKTWMLKRPEDIKRVRERLRVEIPKACIEAERLGYAAVWRHIGYVPTEIYEAGRIE